MKDKGWVKNLLWIPAVFYGVLWIVFSGGRSVCLWKNAAGIPCPGCGLSRAWLAVFRLDIIEAFRFHPFFLFIPIIGLVLVFPQNRWGKALARNDIFWLVLSGIFLAVYLWRMILIYPGTPPMDRMEASLVGLIGRLIGGWKSP